MNETMLGRISKATFGSGGYDDAMIGLSLTFEGGDGWGTGHFDGWWRQSIEVGTSTKWTEADRDAAYAKSVRLLDDTLRAAKKSHVEQLVGTPVEVTFENNTLKSWRVLTEVL